MREHAKNRLSDLKQQEAQMAAVEGEKTGIEWAAETAGCGQLKRLERLVSDPYGNDFMLILDSDRCACGGPHHELVRRINGIREDDFDESMGEEFWEKLGVNVEFHLPFIEEFVRGFVEGALSVLEEADL